MAAPRSVEGSLCYNGHKITYQLTWKKVKNINLRVKPDGCVALSAPKHTPLATVESFLLSKANWVLRAQEKYAVLAQQAPAAEKNTVLYLGEPLELRPQYGPKNQVSFLPSALIVSTPQPQNTEAVARLVENWLQKQGQQILPLAMERAQSLFAQYRLPKPQIKLRKMRARWGSCQSAAGVITLNSRLIHVPYHCIVAVAAHEMAHFLHPNHSSAFYAVLTNALPQYPQYKQTLSAYAMVLQKQP